MPDLIFRGERPAEPVLAYDVMIYCRTGTWHLEDSTAVCGWFDDYHTITWATYDTWEEAVQIAGAHMRDNPLQCRRAWVEPR